MNNLETNLKTRRPQERIRRYKEEPYEDIRSEKQNNLKKKLGGQGSAAEWKREKKESVY